MRIFQYGSNMDRARIESRIGAVRNLGKTELPRYRLVFDVHSDRNNCAAADIMADDLITSRVLGRLYDITDEQAKVLDGFEGVRKGNYERQNVTIPGHGQAMTYVGTDKARDRFRADFRDELPSNEYLSHLINGLEDPAIHASLYYISKVIKTGRGDPSPNRHVTAIRTFDNRQDYRRSTVGLSESARNHLGVGPGDFVTVTSPNAMPHIHLCVQRLPKDMVDVAREQPYIATLSNEVRKILALRKRATREGQNFNTVFDPVEIYSAV